jgi:hypothetical protein
MIHAAFLSSQRVTTLSWLEVIEKLLSGTEIQFNLAKLVRWMTGYGPHLSTQRTIPFSQEAIMDTFNFIE